MPSRCLNFSRPAQSPAKEGQVRTKKKGRVSANNQVKTEVYDCVLLCRIAVANLS
jgi:hypothetical protein